MSVSSPPRRQATGEGVQFATTSCRLDLLGRCCSADERSCVDTPTDHSKMPQSRMRALTTQSIHLSRRTDHDDLVATPRSA